MILLAFLKCLRPKQWTKNLLLFAGIVFAKRWDEPILVQNVIMGFLVFCALSGVVYIVNDILDVEKDRQHPKKKNRPIPSGAISPMAAGIGGLILGAAALFVAYQLTFGFFIASVIYVSLVTLYSLVLKHMVILDIMAIALGFVVRAMAGIEVLKIDAEHTIEVTPFFILTTLFLALFLAVGKRRNELSVMSASGKAGETRSVLKDYSIEYLDLLLTLATTGVIGAYAAWATLGELAKVNELYTMAFTMPFVLYGIFRYLYLVLHRDQGEAPETLLITDIPLMVTVVLWLATVMTLLSL